MCSLIYSSTFGCWCWCMVLVWSQWILVFIPYHPFICSSNVTQLGDMLSVDGDADAVVEASEERE